MVVGIVGKVTNMLARYHLNTNIMYYFTSLLVTLHICF
jgi:hypothetical protein